MNIYKSISYSVISLVVFFSPMVIFAEDTTFQTGMCSQQTQLDQKLRLGDRDGKYSLYQKEHISQVKILQSHLNRLGYGSGSVDGVIGPVTKGAIQRMQVFLGVQPDGIVGPVTIAAINNSCGPQSNATEEAEQKEKLLQDSQRQLLAELQKKLAELLELKRMQDEAAENNNSEEGEGEEETTEEEREEQEEVTHKHSNENQDSDEPYVVYTVNANGDIVPDNKDDTKDIDQEIWDIFSGITGKEYAAENINNFILFDNEENEFSAFVIKTRNWEKWDISINAAYVDLSKGTDGDLVETLVHEFNHIFSLNEDQLDPRKSEKECEVTYWTGEGCAYSNSYINVFVNEFWDSDMLENELTAEEIANNIEKAENIYTENKDMFNTPYSAVNAVEDMAESFTFFILNNKKFITETVANEKINFFYEYEELVEMREDIRSYLDTLYIIE